MFDAYTGTCNDLCNIIFYFRKLQAPRSALVCGATCGMHVFANFVDKFFGLFRPEIRYGALDRGSWNWYKMLLIHSSSIWHKAFDPPNVTQYIHLPFDTKLSTRHAGRQLQSDEIPDSKFTHRYTAANQVRTEALLYGSAEGPPRGVENRNLLSHPDDLRKEAYFIRMT